jgi:hypothetical protein
MENMEKDALISDCQKYRYWLSRCWDKNKKSCLFIMLNPSTADDKIDDPTIKKCVFYAKKFGYGSMFVVNLFAYRATDRSILKKAEEPVGKNNDKIILQFAEKADSIITGWGNDGKYLNRSENIVKLLESRGHKLFCLKLNKSKEPCHPLYVKNSVLKPIAYFGS